MSRSGGLGGLLQRCLGGGAGGFDAGALDGEQLGFSGTDGAGDVAVAAGLAGLALQAGELGFQLGAQVLGASHVGFGSAQLQLRFVAASMQAGDAGGFFQHSAAVFGAGGDQGADAALADHAGSAGTGCQVGEQGLHVARPHLLAVHPVGAAGAAGDLAADLKLRLFVEGGRNDAGGLVEEQRDLGDIARGTGGGAGEDDIVHLAAAQAAGAVLAHGPAERLHHVRLAAAVRADDAGQPRQYLHADRFGETLEPGNAEAAEADGQTGHSCGFTAPPPSRGGGVFSILGPR